MKLSALDPSFIGGYKVENGHVMYCQLPSVDGAQGILFWCPECGKHAILCWFTNPRSAPRVPDDASPRPGRWSFSGDTFDTLTLSPSVDISRIDDDNPAHPGRCYWHGWVQNGEAR
jgi:hypothetical protein